MTDYIVNMSESQVQTHFRPGMLIRERLFKNHTPVLSVCYPYCDHVSIIAVHRLSNYLCDIDDLF